MKDLERGGRKRGVFSVEKTWSYSAQWPVAHLTNAHKLWGMWFSLLFSSTYSLILHHFLFYEHKASLYTSHFYSVQGSYSTMLNHICHSSAILVTITTWRPHVALVFLFVSSFAPCNTPSAHSSVSLYPPATPRGCYDNAFTTQCGWFSQMHMQFLSSP